MLIEHLVDLGEDAAKEGVSQGELDVFYKEARQKFDADEEFADRSRHRVVSLQSGDPDTRRLWQILVDMSTTILRRDLTTSWACCSRTTTSWGRASTTTCCRR